MSLPEWGFTQWLEFALVAGVVLFLLKGIRFIPNNKVGIVEMRISPKGSIDKGVIALHGEAGFQPHMLRGGLHYLPLERSEEGVFQRMAEVLKERAGFSPVVIKGHDDEVGIVTVHDGPSLSPGQIIAPSVGHDAANTEVFHNSFQDPERFLTA